LGKIKIDDMEKKNFFISTAIPYVNEKPHLGFALEIVQADVIARYHRLLGDNVFFLTGTDENSLKNVKAAEKEGILTKELVDRNSQKYFQLKNALNLSFDDFIRTTQKRHLKGAQKLWLACQKDIYKKTYRGLYCVGCEEFYKENELIDGLCPEHQTKPELVEEENYFFKLSKYQEKLKKIIEKDKIKIIPKERKNEIFNFIKQKLEDICISRSAQRAKGWGIDVPGDPSQKIWVWFDALSNYINALGYPNESKKFDQFWQKNKNKLHIIGKGILRFHAVYWPAILLSAKLSLPNKIFVHGYITCEGQKMSKSLGNIIDPFELVKKYGTDSVRYFLLREIPPTQDFDFTIEKFEKRYNSDLARGLGNLTARVVNLAKIAKIKSISENKVSTEIKKIVNKTSKESQKFLDEFEFNKALQSIWDLISFSDKYIEEKRAWKKTENQPKIINNLLFILKNIAILLEPFLPQTSQKIIKQINKKEAQILFPKIK
jgi:methionyl-tRNA synthetase